MSYFSESLAAKSARDYRSARRVAPHHDEDGDLEEGVSGAERPTDVPVWKSSSTGSVGGGFWILPNVSRRGGSSVGGSSTSSRGTPGPRLGHRGRQKLRRIKPALLESQSSRGGGGMGVHPSANPSEKLQTRPDVEVIRLALLACYVEKDLSPVCPEYGISVHVKIGCYCCYAVVCQVTPDLHLTHGVFHGVGRRQQSRPAYQLIILNSLVRQKIPHPSFLLLTCLVLHANTPFWLWHSVALMLYLRMWMETAFLLHRHGVKFKTAATAAHTHV